jgi:hypothetical protein
MTTNATFETQSMSQRRLPIMVEALALGAGLTVPFTADATLMITDINQTLNPGDILSVNLDTGAFQSGVNLAYDYSVGVASKSSYVKSLDAGASISGVNLTNYAYQFSAGGQVGASYFDGTIASELFTANPYNQFGGGWASIGAHGFVGLRLETGMGQYNYGWLELTRGSLTVGRMGYETDPNTAAQIPETVPEPSTLLLLVSGAAGIAAMRRRQRAVAAH